MSPQHPKRLVDVVADLKFPEIVHYGSPETLDGYTVEVDIVPAEGRLMVSRVSVESTTGNPVDANVLRRLPLAQIIREVAAANLEHHGPAARAFVMTQNPEEVRRLGPGNDAALEALAMVYARAYAVGNEPTKAVEQTFGFTRSTASRWISRARDRGFLSRTQQGKAGG